MPYKFSFRTDYTVSFEMRGIPETQMTKMLRLQYHLRNAGSVSLDTEDAAGRTYTTCYIAPGADVTIHLSDRSLLEYTMSFKLINGEENPFIVIYTGPPPELPVEPPTIEDLWIWYKADALLGDGYSGLEFPTRWIDSSGNGYHATPDVHLLSPGSGKFYADWPLDGGAVDLNGMPVMYFEDAQMISPAVPASLGRTMIIIARVETGSASASKAFASMNGDINSTFSQFEESFGVASGAWGWDTPSIEIGGSIFNWTIAAVTMTPAEGQCYIDGVAAGAPFAPAITAVDPELGLALRAGPVVIGGYDGTAGGNNATCLIPEVIVYQRALTAAEILDLTNYLTDKYNL